MFQCSKQGAVDVVGGDAPLTGETIEQAYSLLVQCLGHGQPKAVLDLQHVPLIDSIALERLLDIQERFEQRGGSLKLAAPNPLCRDILTVTGVAGQFEIHGQVNGAVGSFSQ